MYKAQNKEAVIVDLGSTVKQWTPVDDTIVNVGGSDGVKAQANKRFVQNVNHSLGAAKTLAVGLAMPALGRRDNINISFNGAVKYYVHNSEPDGESIFHVLPFIARTTNVTEDVITAENMHFLPFQSKYYNVLSVDTNIVVADLGYGHDLKDKGICVGFQIQHSGSSAFNIRDFDGTICCRYNYAPIKTLDKEL
jgi:hypothetical protein